jgi:uncharacterized membrane protein YgaE (UPF0421/DUF939 family)
MPRTMTIGSWLDRATDRRVGLVIGAILAVLTVLFWPPP